MNKSEINKKIALLLGFEVYPITRNGIEMADFCWGYPREFANQQVSAPAYDVPDFVSMLNKINDFARVGFSSPIFKKDFDTRPNLEDLVDNLTDGVDISDEEPA